ncbi:alpha-2-macroglobulin family protein [Pedobacter montanisoli]|uniref:MG2 domain-containing protein n=1 Tax=Pedobacter montanisoli TaxID=2923277 RepID=A0ABS9ZS57_9SPHI|nr:MG2 domain-containing protein [Pedobacter montanisoli]MCJ0741411.1 MG2 domain-containing protein [Pedobacter montanisoli]
MKALVRLILSITLLFILTLNVSAQKADEFAKVDSLALNAQPKEALALINTLYLQAQKNQNTNLLVKAVIYRMLFQSYLTEDAFTEILKDLKEAIAKAKQPEKSILQSVLGQMYWNYYLQNRYQISQRTLVEGNIGDDIKTWSPQKINNEVAATLLASLAQKEILQKTGIEQVKPLLKNDSTNINLRPTLYDVLAHRALDIFSNTYNGITPLDLNRFSFSAMSKTADFRNYNFDTADSSNFNIQALKIFQELIRLHEKDKNQAAMADVELKRLKFIHQNSLDNNKTQVYDNALAEMANRFKSTEIYADFLYEQATLHRNRLLPADSNKNLIKAVELAEKAIRAFPSSTGAHNAKSLIEQIKEKELNLQIRAYIMANQPAQLQVSYKNTDTLYLDIYRIPLLNTKYRRQINAGYKEWIKNKKPLRSVRIILPQYNDYQTHTYITKIEGLPFGNYLLTSLDKNKLDEATTGRYNTTWVTNMVANVRSKYNDHMEYQVLHAKNGEPLTNVKIEELQDDPKVTSAQNIYRTNHKGIGIIPSSEDINTLITHNGDSLLINSYYNYVEPDEDEEVILFTDRPIYRPGQVVYYKGILLKGNNEKNELLTKQQVEVVFRDVNAKEIEKTTLTTNDFGSFQGSFNIPLSKLNGQMTISTTYGSINVQVEEYKRPAFEVIFDPLTQKYKLNDSVKVYGKAISFAGYPVTDAKVSYTVMQHTSPSLGNFRYIGPRTKQVASGNTQTKEGGKFEISFMAAADDPNENYVFDIKAVINDGNGETRENTQSVTLGKKDLLLNSSLGQQLILSKQTDTITYTTTNLNTQPIKAKLKTEWFALTPPGRLTNNSLFSAEKYSLSREEFIRTFPYDEYGYENNPEKWATGKNVWFQELSSDNGQFNIKVNESNLLPGFYKVVSRAINALNDTVTVNQYIRIFNQKPSEILVPREWLIAEKTAIAPNEKALFRVAGLSADSKLYYEVYYKNRIERTEWVSVNALQKVIEIAAKPEYTDGFAVQFIMINNGIRYNSLQQVSITDLKKQLDIKFLTFRDKLQPGEKETWKLQISNKAGEKEMAEMVATLYDSSLDNFKSMSWDKIYTKPVFNYYRYTWNNYQTYINYSLWLMYNNGFRYNTISRQYPELNLYGFNYYGGYNGAYHTYLQNLDQEKRRNLKLQELAKSKLVYGLIKDRTNVVFGVTIRLNEKPIQVNTSADGIYAIDAKVGDKLTFISIGYKTQTIVVGKQKRIDINLEPDESVLNEVVVTSAGEGSTQIRLRGSTSALQGRVAGVQVQAKEIAQDNTIYNFNAMETPAPNADRSMINEVIPRTNFNETAFFYPQLKTNEQGEINIEFTIPQSLTRYKMIGFAHTKDLKTASISKQLITQKQLAVMANAPRFLREGDTIVFSAKLNNLAGKELSGTVALELRDALSGKVIHVNEPNSPLDRSFKISDQKDLALKWTLHIPYGLQAITYKLIAQSGKYSDGEEMTIPVLSNAILVTESLPLNVRGNTSQTFTLDKLLKSGNSSTLRTQSITFEYTSNPVWYAVQALPYLMEYPYECAEQTFSRFYANSFATGIVNSSPQIKSVFNQWKNTPNGEALLSNLEKNAELKTILLEETPWVRNAGNETERKKRIAVLFDLNRMRYELKNNFDKLQGMQLSNGAFPWFTGMREDRYITQHIVMGIGQLQKANLIDQKAFPTFKTLTNKAMIYLDDQLIRDYNDEIKNNGFSRLPLHYLFARSYFEQKNTNADFVKAFNYYLSKIGLEWKTMDTYQQAQAALVLYRNNQKAEALKIINLLKQTAQQSNEMGMYWAANKNGWWWYQNPIETQALLIEAFDEIANDKKAVEEMKIWLLKNKQTNDWKTTKATTAACYALLMRGYNLLADHNEPEIKIGNTAIAHYRKPGAVQEAGTGYEKITINAADAKPEMGRVEIKNNNAGIAWGGLYWQYFENLDKITASNTGIKIVKQLFLQKTVNNGNVLVPLNKGQVLIPGDLVKVRIEIYADRAMEYLHLKDMRSSGFEPVNVISRYKYQDGLSYYESTKDASTNFFISYMPKGTYVFEYPLRVTHSGNFSNGITSLQSMYAPEFTTYSEGIRVNVK